MNLKEKKKLLEWYAKFCKKHELDAQTFDIEAETNTSLTYSENKDAIENKLRPLIKPELMLTRPEARALEEQEASQRRKEAAEVIERFKAQEAKHVVQADKYSILKAYIDIVRRKLMHSLICKSRTGLGKTFVTLNLLKELKADYHYQSGYTTALSLYKTLYNHRDSLILFDDCEGLFNDNKGIAILKSCLWAANGEQRTVFYETTSKRAEDVPSAFEFAGSIIILTNEFRNGRRGENFKALISRSMCFELEMSFEEVYNIAYKIVTSKNLPLKQEAEVLRILDTEVSEASEFNLRELHKLIEMTKYDSKQANTLFAASFRQDRELILVNKLMNSLASVQDQIRLFVEETGKSRATFFRHKLKIRELTGEVSKSQQKTV